MKNTDVNIISVVSSISHKIQNWILQYHFADYFVLQGATLSANRNYIKEMLADREHIGSLYDWDELGRL